MTTLSWAIGHQVGNYTTWTFPPDSPAFCSNLFSHSWCWYIIDLSDVGTCTCIPPVAQCIVGVHSIRDRIPEKVRLVSVALIPLKSQKRERFTWCLSVQQRLTQITWSENKFYVNIVQHWKNSKTSIPSKYIMNNCKDRLCFWYEIYLCWSFQAAFKVLINESGRPCMTIARINQ